MQDVIRDIVGDVPISRPFPWVEVVVAVAVALLCAIAYWFYRRRKRSEKPVQVAPPIPPGKEALTALDTLQCEDIKQYYIDLSSVVRRFVERRFSLRAPEQTTEEFLLTTSRSQALPDRYRDMLTSFLREADMVKFAQYQLSPSHAKESADHIKKFIMESHDDEGFLAAYEEKNKENGNV